MTNQMKRFIQVSMCFSWVGLVFCLLCLFYNGFGYNNVFSYVILGANVVLTIFLTAFYIKAVVDEKKYKRQIFLAKKLLELRESAILDFYRRYNLQPLYKDGKLITPDELLKIVTKVDKEGKLNPSIYETLGIDPVLDKNGNEIPIVLVLKHLIKKVKKTGLGELSKKFKGFFLKGSKKEKKAEPKKEAKKKTAEKSAKKKGKGKDKFGFDAPPPKDKGGNKKGGEKKKSEPEKPKAAETKKQDTKEKKPEVIKLKQEEVKNEVSETKKIETMSSLFKQETIKKQEAKPQTKVNFDVGEFSPE